MEHLIIEIMERTEDLRDDDGYVLMEGGYESFRVSTRKLEAFKEEHAHEYNYVGNIIGAAQRGVKDYGYTSRKYSFGDTPDWFKALEPDEGCQDPVHHIDVDVGR